MKPKKTGGREVAAFGLFVWAGVTWRVFFDLTPSDVAGYMGAYGAITTAVWASVVAAFGWKRVSGAVAAKMDPEGAEQWRD